MRPVTDWKTVIHQRLPLLGLKPRRLRRSRTSDFDHDQWLARGDRASRPGCGAAGLDGEALDRRRSALKEGLRRHGSVAGGLCGARCQHEGLPCPGVPSDLTDDATFRSP